MDVTLYCAFLTLYTCASVLPCLCSRTRLHAFSHSLQQCAFSPANIKYMYAMTPRPFSKWDQVYNSHVCFSLGYFVDSSEADSSFNGAYSSIRIASKYNGIKPLSQEVYRGPRKFKGESAFYAILKSHMWHIHGGSYWTSEIFCKTLGKDCVYNIFSLWTCIEHTYNCALQFNSSPCMNIKIVTTAIYNFVHVTLWLIWETWFPLVTSMAGPQSLTDNFSVFKISSLLSGQINAMGHKITL